ncbi:G-box-binding factor 4 isoform X1 [Capsicum chacoense]
MVIFNFNKILWESIETLSWCECTSKYFNNSNFTNYFTVPSFELFSSIQITTLPALSTVQEEEGQRNLIHKKKRSKFFFSQSYWEDWKISVKKERKRREKRKEIPIKRGVMASKVMLSASTTTPNSDPSSSSLHPHPITSSSSSSLHHQLHSHPSTNFGSMNMDEILHNMYSDSDPFASDPTATDAAAVNPVSGGGDVGPSKTVDEVWREIVAAGGGRSREPEMTLEDFLTKAGAVTEEDVRVPVIAPPPPPPPPPPSSSTEVLAPAVGGGFVVDNMMGTGNCQFSVAMQQNGPGGYGMEPPPPPHMGYANGVVAAISGSGRGKRRSTVEELPADKATQQKQRRMIKNRESAARSRERKQEEKNKERLKQILENLIPVVEKRRPPRILRRVRSMSW